MASINDTTFAKYAGQEGSGGIRTTPYSSPVVDFGAPFNRSAMAALSLVNGMIPTIGKIFVHSTNIYQPKLLNAFHQESVPYGMAVEDVAFNDVGIDKKADGTCIPRHTDSLHDAQLSAVNLAGNFNINIYDKEISKAAMSASDVASYVAEKMKLLEAGYYDLMFNAAIGLLSDCTPGKRSISSYTSAAGAGDGSAVTFANTPEGWAKVIKDHSDWIIPEVSSLGTEPAIANETSGETTIDMVLDFLQEIKSITTGMKYPSKTMNVAGRNTFSKAINVVMESHVLDAFDRVIQDQSKNYYEGATARGFINGLEGVTLYEIPSFMALPAYDSTTYPASYDYDDYRQVAAIFDSDAAGIFTFDYSLESQRCMAERMTGYNLQFEKLFRMYRGANTASILCAHTPSSP